MMKKVILSIAIFSAATLSSFAATDNNATSCNKAQTECSKNGGECKKEKHGKADKGNHGMKAFEGINLTDAQKTQIEALRAEFKAKKDSMKQKGEKREYLTEEQKKQLKAEKMAKRQQAKQDFLDKVKAILTPEQYTQFLDNTQKMEANKEKGMKKGGKHSKGKKGQKH